MRGLGCPDWPGCYGHIKVPTQDHEIAHAQTIFPDHDIHPEKAWLEMIHRYIAGGLGLLVLLILVLCLKTPKHRKIAAHHSAIDPLSSGTRHVDSDDETHAYSGDVASYWWLQPDFLLLLLYLRTRPRRILIAKPMPAIWHRWHW